MSRSPGKGRSAAPRRRGRRRREGGYTLIGLLVALAVINIVLGVAVTSWVTLDRRAREAELLWRGRKYVQALRCHQQETGGLPTDLEELLESDCIRRLWPDPMTDDGEWELIRLGDVAPEGEDDGIVPDPGTSGSPFGRLGSGGLTPSISFLTGSGGESSEAGQEGGLADALRAYARTQAAGSASSSTDTSDRSEEGTGVEPGGRDAGPEVFLTPSHRIRQAELQQRIQQLRARMQQGGDADRLREQMLALQAEAAAMIAGSREAELLAQLARAQGEQAADPETGRQPATAQSMLEALRAQRERLTGAVRDRDSSSGDPRSIVGVVSRSGSEGFRAYRGSRLYSDWRFMVQGEAIR